MSQCDLRGHTPFERGLADNPCDYYENEGARRSKRQRLETERVVDVSHKFVIPAALPARRVEETDEHRLAQRQKQIDFGKNTLGYERYTECIPRSRRTRADPATPLLEQICSKRAFDGQVKKWRKLLHFYDPPQEQDEEVAQILSHPGVKASMEAKADTPIADQSGLASKKGREKTIRVADGWAGSEIKGGMERWSEYGAGFVEKEEHQLQGKREDVLCEDRDDGEEGNNNYIEIYRDWDDD